MSITGVGRIAKLFEVFRVGEEYHFPYQLENQVYATERLDTSGVHIPSTKGLWLYQPSEAGLITHLFLGNSASELIAFAELMKNRPPNFLRQSVFVSVGLLPQAGQLNRIMLLFPKVKWHLILGADLLGKITDAQVAAWLKHHETRFSLHGDQIVAWLDGNTYHFYQGNFSLSRFEKVTGLRSGARTHKPPAGVPSYLSLVYGSLYHT